MGVFNSNTRRVVPSSNHELHFDFEEDKYDETDQQNNAD